MIFGFFLILHRTCCGYSLESPLLYCGCSVGEAILMSTHNRRFCGEIWKIFPKYHQIPPVFLAHNPG